MREISSLMSREMRSSPEDSLATSTVTSLGRSAMARSLASTAYADADDIPTGVKMIIMMTTPPIRRLMAATVVETIPGCLRLLRQEGA
jgi:hypothetical protein